MKVARSFLNASTVAGIVQYALIAGGVGLGISAFLYETSLMLNAKFEAITAALKHQNY
jgi:Flp pilus assembly pilin Flp